MKKQPQPSIRRIFTEKKKGYDTEACGLLFDLQENLGICSLTQMRVLNRYDIEGIRDEEYMPVRNTILSEPPLDQVWDERFPQDARDTVFGIEYLPGQYDQRADSAAQCIQLLTHRSKPLVVAARILVLQGNLSSAEVLRIKSYLINPVDSREAALKKPQTLELRIAAPLNVETIPGFIRMTQENLEKARISMGLAMDIQDLLFCRDYFRNRERRDPTITEIRMLDTYWSDHCRHTTFLTRIEEVQIPVGRFTKGLEQAWGLYRETRKIVDPTENKPVCLMDIAQISMRELRHLGMLPDLDVSDEINACSIEIDVEVDGKKEKWLLMFKNETHNHPTEIEPFGGAATCLGGAIRDPLSGRAYVFSAMRITGSGDPRSPVERTFPGKLPQRKITREAARGYSAYGNQVGLATGQVAEIYHEGYVAKRMEIGAVLGAVRKADVIRKAPMKGDRILLLGGATGRDGIGGATGSSKAHTEDSLVTCGAEVQKGNPVIERKIQRLFRNPAVTRMIKRCNDFGAGGVAVAVGELAEGVDIDLDAIPKKYEGLDGTELALSESQERMAVVVAAADAEDFRVLAAEENLEAREIAQVTDKGRLRMQWQQQVIVDISRDFLDSAGLRRSAVVTVDPPKLENNFFHLHLPQKPKSDADLKTAWMNVLSDLNVCSQQGLVEQFDSSIGRATVLSPFGGGHQKTPAEGLATRIPLLSGRTATAAVMTHGFNPDLASWSPFHGAMFAVVEAVAKAVAMGADFSRIRLSLQEYFEKLGNDRKKWGKPFAALLGAYYAQNRLGIAAIGGKDSMSGSFKDIHVPPTLVAFAVTAMDSHHILSPEFKKTGSFVVLLPARRNEEEIVDFDSLRQNFQRVHRLAHEGKILSAMSVRGGGLVEALSKMAFGNRKGMKLEEKIDTACLFSPDFGSLVLEIDASESLEKLFPGLDMQLMGITQDRPTIDIHGCHLLLEEIEKAWESPLKTVFPQRVEGLPTIHPCRPHEVQKLPRASAPVAKPRVLIATFPGINCEYDTELAFRQAGAQPDTLVFRNLTPSMIEESLDVLVSRLGKSQILVIPGGFSAGDEPEGSGKFICAVFRNPRVFEAMDRFLSQGDGLILGICNGFQALIKLGLVPDGRIREPMALSPTLTFNTCHYYSRMVRTRIVSNLSPWFSLCRVGDTYTIPIAHGEGRFIASSDQLEHLQKNGQIAAQYVDMQGNPTSDSRFNPNGSAWAVEAVSSPDGRILGKMAHPERVDQGLFRNIPGIVEQPIFRSGVHYFS